MSDASSGPVATLPGATQQPPVGTPCDHHSDRLATMRVQGETDSFGCEYLDLCSDCYERLTKAIESQRQQPHHCDWCKKEKLGCRPHRDFEEGAGGAVYVVCPDCIRMEYARVASDYGDYDD